MHGVPIKCGAVRPFSLSGGVPLWEAPKPDAVTFRSACQDCLYTVMMYDVTNVWLHWMVVNVPAKDLSDAPVNAVLEHGDEHAQYLGPGPFLGETNVYAFLIYRQGAGRIDVASMAPIDNADGSWNVPRRRSYDLAGFAHAHGLGEPLAVQKMVNVGCLRSPTSAAGCT
jgi:hypothetical protein